MPILYIILGVRVQLTKIWKVKMIPPHGEFIDQIKSFYLNVKLSVLQKKGS